MTATKKEGRVGLPPELLVVMMRPPFDAWPPLTPVRLLTPGRLLDTVPPLTRGRLLTLARLTTLPSFGGVVLPVHHFASVVAIVLYAPRVHGLLVTNPNIKNIFFNTISPNWTARGWLVSLAKSICVIYFPLRG